MKLVKAPHAGMCSKCGKTIYKGDKIVTVDHPHEKDVVMAVCEECANIKEKKVYDLQTVERLLNGE